MILIRFVLQGKYSTRKAIDMAKQNIPKLIFFPLISEHALLNSIYQYERFFITLTFDEFFLSRLTWRVKIPVLIYSTDPSIITRTRRHPIS